LNRSTIQVRHTLIEVNGRQELGEPKTQKSRRCVHLPEIAGRWTDFRFRFAGHGSLAIPIAQRPDLLRCPVANPRRPVYGVHFRQNILALR
jgi:hypothetical protein